MEKFRKGDFVILKNDICWKDKLAKVIKVQNNGLIQVRIIDLPANQYTITPETIEFLPTKQTFYNEKEEE